MANLKTTYLGLELKSPIIAGACDLTVKELNLKRLESAGAGAIVYKSLFEEQIHLERLEMEEGMDEYSERHAESTSLFPALEHAGPQEHLTALRKAKQTVDIPIIASLNAVYKETWIEYAQKIEETGVDALELNFYHNPKDFVKSADEVVASQVEIIRAVKAVVKIPVSVKLSPFYGNILHAVQQFDNAGADGIVLFNRLFQPDINIETEQLEFPWNLSTSNDNKLSLRFAALLFDEVKADICTNTGVHTGEDVISMILAGSSVTQVVSSLYLNGIEHIEDMHKDITKWMNQKGYDKIDDFKGKLSKKNINDPFAYKRAQYINILFNTKELFKKYPMP